MIAEGNKHNAQPPQRRGVAHNRMNNTSVRKLPRRAPPSTIQLTRQSRNRLGPACGVHGPYANMPAVAQLFRFNGKDLF